MDSSGLWLFRKPELFAVCEDSGSLALCNETANILAPYQLSKRISPLLHPFCSMVCLLLSVHLTLSFFPLLFQLSYSHLLIFSSFCLSLSLTLLPSHSFPAHFYLSFHPSPPLQCSHLIIPSRNIFTFEPLGSY